MRRTDLQLLLPVIFLHCPWNLDYLFRISTLVLQSHRCTSGGEKKKSGRARPKSELYHEDVGIVLSIESACSKFSSFQCWETPSGLSFYDFYFCILSSWQQGQIIRANQCFPCMQVLLLRNESLFILFVKLLNLMWGVWSLFLVPGSFLTLVMLQYCCLLSESRVGPRYLMSYPSNFFHRWDNFLFSIWSFFSSSQLQTLSASLCYSIQHRWRLNSKSF